MSRPREAMSRRSPGVSSLPLQLREASPGAEIWTGSQNGWVDQAGAERTLLIEAAFSNVEECSIRALRDGPAGQISYSRSPPGGLTTIDDGSTHAGQLFA